MLATLSVERRVRTKLDELWCGGRPFVEVAKALGVEVSQGRFSEALNGKREFSPEVGNRLLEILERMKELQNDVDLPLDWTRTRQVATALTVRLVARVAKELEVADTADIQEAAAKATQEVTQ